jgi:hypothetical protein
VTRWFRRQRRTALYQPLSPYLIHETTSTPSLGQPGAMMSITRRQSLCLRLERFYHLTPLVEVFLSQNHNPNIFYHKTPTS